MMSDNTGGPAFPGHVNPKPGYLDDASQGMTLRDWFAGKALMGLLATPTEPGVPDDLNWARHLSELSY
jgi:hypothetical protein